MHEKSALLLHALSHSPTTGTPRMHGKESAPIWAHLHLHAVRIFEIVPVFLWNDLLALMLNSLSAHLDFSPPAPQSHGLPQNAVNYTKIPVQWWMVFLVVISRSLLGSIDSCDFSFHSFLGRKPAQPFSRRIKSFYAIKYGEIDFILSPFS